MIQNSQNDNPLHEPSIHKDVEESEDLDRQKPLIALFDPYMSQDAKKTDKLNTFYSSLNIQCLGCASQTLDKSAIGNKKTNLGKRYHKQTQGVSVPQDNFAYDGLFTTGEVEKTDSLNLYRLEKRLVRDCREQFYSENGELNLSKSYLDEKVSRLINISFEENPSLAIYQKNAILSMRNNQSKSDPFEFQIILGKLAITKHSLKVEEERKFQELRPYLEWLQKYLEYPTLPHLASIKEALEQKHRELVNKGAKADVIRQAKQRLEDVNDQSRDESLKVEDNMKTILRLWQQIKTVRRTTHMTIVPWKLQVKQFKFEGRNQYQIGVNSAQLTQESDVHEAQKERRAEIRKEQYYVKVLINGNEVTRSSKQNLQWPSFIVTFNEKLKINLYTKPSIAVFEILQVGFIDKVIDTIAIKLPGEHANTLTSSQRLLLWQQFSLNGDEVRKKAQPPSEPAGFLSYRTQWKGTGSKMPPSRAVFADEDQRETTGDQQSMSEIQDPNDPRRVVNKHKLKAKIPDRDVIYQQSTLPFAGIISTRQLLLKLREKSQLQNIVIPLTEQAIRKRPDLIDLIKRERELAVLEQEEEKQQKVYNPVDGRVFGSQGDLTKERIKQVLRKICLNRHSSSGFVNISKYKLVDQVINQYTFDQMVSPIVVFFTDLFTQQRKLGPKKQTKLNARSNITEFSFALQANSGWNVPMRDTSGNLIMRYRQIRDQIMQQFLIQQVGIFSGGSLFQQQPHFGGNAFQYYNNTTGQMDYGVRGFDGQPIIPGQGMNQFMSNVNVNYNQLATQGNAQEMLSNIERVKPFIEFNYGTIMKRTREVEGTAPQWNEQLEIKFDCKKQKINLQQAAFKTGKFLTITLFDMYEESQPTNTISELKVKKTKYYLGHIQIPLSTVICVPRITGFFRVNRPLLLFGYNTMPQTILGQSDSQAQFKSENPLVPTHLSLNLTVVPLIDSSFAYANDRKFLIGYQKTEFLQFASDWLDQLNIKRYVRLWMNNSDGQSVFISRFICEVDPPPIRATDDPEKWIQITAHFVSFIPYKSSCKLLDNTEQFHLSLREFLDAKMGDDHAFLLCSYFNAIDKLEGRLDLESLVVVGKAFPEGKTTYVMRRNKQTKEFQLWNPRTADCYYLKEEASKYICPLHEVGCLVSVDNVYVNIQAKSHPFEISFDIENTNFWKPFLAEEKLAQFFNGKVPQPYMTLPVTEEVYEKSHGLSQQIELEIYEYIKNMMETERKKLFRPHTFRMNVELSKYIRDKLLMELHIIKSQCRITGIDSPLYSERRRAQWSSIWQNIEELKSTVKNKVDTDRRIYGFPISLSYTTLEDIWAQVSQFQVHMNEREDMEFVLAVRCFEYKCFVTAVWIFVGSIQ